MKPGAKIESGIELLARLSARPSVQGLESSLFVTGPKERETVELCGNLSSGKTLLLSQLLAKCILPSSYDGIELQGLGVAAVFINTDHHFRLSKLVRLMLGIVERACKLDGREYSQRMIRDRVVIPAVENLVVVDCYDNNQFTFTLEMLDKLLDKDHRIGLIAVDSISSFYWQDRQADGVWSIDQYLKNLLKIVQKHTFQYNIVMIYTRPQDFASKGQNNSVELTDEPIMGKINYRITLGSACVIETAQGKREICFKIGDEGITWVTEDRE